jgi:hypothetical protein
MEKTKLSKVNQPEWDSDSLIKSGQSKTYQQNEDNKVTKTAPFLNNEKIGSIELDKIFKLDEVPNNSIICYKIQDIGKWIIPVIENFSNKYGKLLKDKNLQLLVLREKDSLESVSEAQMEKMGWIRKNKSKIITLN